MDAQCYGCDKPTKRYPSSGKRGVLCGKCKYKRNSAKYIENMAKWRAVNRERMRINESARQLSRKKASIKAYGGKCSWCGINELGFLVIDHMDDDGAKERESRKHCSNIHVWLKRMKYPSGFQVLCGNCNSKKEIVRRRKICSQSWTKSQAAKQQVMSAYGNVCKCCYESDMDKLEIDHINGGGTQAKKRYPSRNVYFFLVNQPVKINEFQILCHNCNQSKALHGGCIHQIG